MKANLNTFWASLIVEELVRNGIEYFCISPGSRSTPLVVAVARNKKARSIVCYDERSCAFFAVGFARATGKPAVVITTSGTAAANLYPAVTEASNDKVPLIILTADRPPELIDCGANQTIDQPKMFGAYTRWHFDLPCPDETIAPEMVLTTVDQALYRSRYNNAGPVHINCRYREPLEPDGAVPSDDYLENIAKWQESAEPFSAYRKPAISVSKETLDSLVGIIDSSERVMVVAGKLNTDKERRATLGLIEKLKCPVYADLTSGLRLTECGTNLIRYYDPELISAEFNERAKPSVVIHLGGRTTSKRVGQFFDLNRPDNFVVIKNSPQRYDPVHAVTMHIEADVGEVCLALCDQVKTKSAGEYAKFFELKAELATEVITGNIDNEERMSEPFIAREISKSLPKGGALFVSNSMPIRDVDLYGVTTRADVNIAANRGVSGIDGIISSAAGFAEGKETPTTALVGDMAFMHDINGLSLLGKIGVPVIVVVINNKGGGIFHFLPISECDDVFEDYFAASHDFTLAGVAETFGIDYYKVDNKDAFAEAYGKAVKKGAAAVIEASTDREADFRLRRKIKAEIITAMEKS